jgi:protein phosphatase
MGGARAGEVASRLAAAAFREFHEADELEPEQRLEAIIQEANRRIFERAREDTGLSGMGTTVTAALLGQESIAIGHVGDSRAYRARADELEQLTQDHSLVADLIRSGRLTPEEAEAHPQRSVITRALGTDPDVDVDTFAVEIASGDLFLICSDGLTSMVPEEEILKHLRESDSLEQAAKALIKAANKRGGEDNITVILFRVDAGDPLDDTLVAGNGRGDTEDLEDTLTGLEPITDTRAHWEEAPEHGTEPKRRPRVRRGLLWGLVVLAALAVLTAAAFWGLSEAHFVGADENGNVAIFQGVPWELGGGAQLYRAKYVSGLQAVQLSPGERDSLFDHSLVSYAEARERIAPYEEEATP